MRTKKLSISGLEIIFAQPNIRSLRDFDEAPKKTDEEIYEAIVAFVNAAIRRAGHEPPELDSLSIGELLDLFVEIRTFGYVSGKDTSSEEGKVPSP